jgi:hypothetical protein
MKTQAKQRKKYIRKKESCSARIEDYKKREKKEKRKKKKEKKRHENK